MKEKKRPTPDDEEQSARFVETARKVESEDAENKFEEAIRKIAQAKEDSPGQENSQH